MKEAFVRRESGRCAGQGSAYVFGTVMLSSCHFRRHGLDDDCQEGDCSAQERGGITSRFLASV